MEYCKSVITPRITRSKLSKGDESMEDDQTLYKEIIGILLYVINSRPDVMKAIVVVARLQYAPRETHVQAIKRIFIYLNSILDFRLWYPKRE